MDYYSMELVTHHEKQKNNFKKQAGRNAAAFQL
ncbi:MAG: hypothetical protein JWP78_3090 [Mucilaginibacter sp.]|nr:hypothetical protein [Mucilaginibacter sp.]